MKIGINLLLWTDHPTAKHTQLIEQIKAWGFDGVEYPVIAMSPAEIRDSAKILDNLGLGRTALLAYGANQADPLSPDPQLRRKAVDLIKHSIDKTRDLGARALVGPFQAGLGHFTGSGPTEDEWKRAVEVIREAAEHAASMHVDLAVEPLNRFEMFLMNTVRAAARFCRDVDMSNVGLLADTHHSNIEEHRTGKAWAAVSDHIFHVHISENHRGIPGQGQAVRPDVFQSLRENGYDRWMTIESFGLKVPGIISPLHLWRPFFKKEEDVATIGIRHIRDGWEAAG